MKVEIYLTSLENNLTQSSTAIKEFKSLQNDGNNIIEKFALTSAIIEANERISFLELND